MQKIKMSRGVTLTFEEGCKRYLENCRQRNLRDGTINHYRQSYLYFYKYFDPKMPIEDIDEQTYKDYVIHLKKVLHNDTSINSYLRDLITTIHFFMNEGWLPHFKMQAIKVDKSHIETYNENELQFFAYDVSCVFISKLFFEMYLDKLWDICYTFTNDKIANPKGEFHMKVPISLIIDDPAPVISVYKAHSPGALTNDGREIIPAFPNSLLFDFCDVVEAYGIKGKFSIVPMPGNKGDIRYKIEGVSEEDMREWIDTVKSRLVPSFTVGPEMLTHYKAVDLISGNALEIDEREWAKNQDRSTLTPYIVKALSILNQVGFDAHGVTSPWDFGSTVESEYVASIANAVYEVTGKSESWYFLHTLRNSKNMKPWVAYDEDGKTVISIPSTTMDAFWPTKDTAQCSDEYVLSIADKLINSDGTEGEIIRILNDGGYPILLTHWQSLMSNGLGTGIKALKAVASRVEKYLSDRVEWKSFDEIMQIVLSDKTAFPKPECVK